MSPRDKIFDEMVKKANEYQLVDSPEDLTNEHWDEITSKGELVDDKDTEDMAEGPDFIRQNPYKTPPNSLTSKAESINEKD